MAKRIRRADARVTRVLIDKVNVDATLMNDGIVMAMEDRILVGYRDRLGVIRGFETDLETILRVSQEQGITVAP